MAQKINPISLRLGKTNRNFDFSWFNDSNYVNLLMRDLKIQCYINFILKKIKYSSARYLIQNLPNKVKIHVFFCNSNKTRKHISKIFYLNNQKKIKKSKKKFFNTQYSIFSIKQKRVFNYLAKSFNDNLSNIIPGKADNVLHDYKLDSLSFSKNYLKLIYPIKKYDQLYIRYFLIKYFSSKFPIMNLKKKISSNETPEFILQSKNQGVSQLKTKTQFKQYQNVLYCYTENFLFFNIYKNKEILAFNYFNFKKKNYKIITHDFTKSTFNLLKKTIYKSQSEKNNNFFLKLNSSKFHEKNLSLNLSAGFFFDKNAITRIKILRFLNKVELKCKQMSNFNLNSLNLFQFSLWKNLFFMNNASCKLFSRQILDKVNTQNLKYYNVSLMNNECFNDTYTNYCKLSKSYKYYNFIYSMAFNQFQNQFQNKLNKKKMKFFSKNLGKNLGNDYFNFQKNVINNHLDETKFKENLNLNAGLLQTKKKITLISPPYKHHIESILSNHFSCNINFHFFQTFNIFQNALFFIDEIVYYIEKKLPFFKIKNYILKKLTEQNYLRIKGIRVMCSGRIKGKSKKAQRSKIQNFKYGETSLHVFSSKIDFKSKNAFTSFGTLGVKVWICFH